MRRDINVIAMSERLKTERWQAIIVRDLSPLACPFPVNIFVTKEESLEQYKEWLRDKLNEMDWDVTTALDNLVQIYSRYKRLDLVFADDFLDHGKVIAGFLNKFLDTYGEK